MCVCVCVCVCVCEREREGEGEGVCVCERERERECVCVYFVKCLCPTNGGWRREEVMSYELQFLSCKNGKLSEYGCIVSDV